jgi:hypothetical protein
VGQDVASYTPLRFIHSRWWPFSFDHMSKEYEVFEKVVASVFEQLSNDHTVKHNDKINGRQVDVSIRAKIAGIDLLIIVQCKAYKTKLDVTYVDELLGTMQDIGAHRGVLVSTKGFSGRAIQRAARCGIDLCIVKDAENRNWKLDLKIPVIYERIHPLIQLSYDINLKAGDNPPRPDKAIINGVNPWDKFKQDWDTGELNLEPGKHVYDFGFKNPTLKLDNGQEREIRNIKVIYTISKHFGFGYIDDIPMTKLMNNISTGQTHIIIDEEAFNKYKGNFVPINSITEAPLKNTVFIKVLDKPDIDKEMKGLYAYKKLD